MNKARKKALKQELKTLSSKQKNKLIIHLFDENDRMMKEHQLQAELMSCLVDKKTASIFGLVQ